MLVVLSDAHLTPDGEGPASLLARAIDRACQEAAQSGAALEIVLGGDVLDLDGEPDGARAPSQAEDAARRLVRVPSHAPFFQALARARRWRATIAYVPGNHDAQVAFPGVRRVLAEASGGPIAFSTWFWRSASGAIVEHGHLYDPCCAPDRLHAIPLEPTIGAVIGELTSRALGVDRHAIDPIAASLPASAFVRLARRCDLAVVASVLRKLLIVRSAPMAPGEKDEFVRLVRAETRSPSSVIETHLALALPRSDLGAVANLPPDRYAEDLEDRLLDVCRQIARLYQAPAVIMGHTHAATVLDLGDAFVLNSGCFVGQKGTFARVVTEGPRVVSADVEEIAA